MSDVVRIHASSGTTGKPTVVGYTANDIETWAGLAARALSLAGVTRDDIVQNAYGYGLFTGGLGLHYGVEKLGAAVVPVSSGNTARQVMLLQDFGTTVLCATPSYALVLAEGAAEAGYDLPAGPLRVGIFGAEPWSFGGHGLAPVRSAPPRSVDDDPWRRPRLVNSHRLTPMPATGNRYMKGTATMVFPAR